MTHPIRYIYLFNLSPKNNPVESKQTPRNIRKT